ncbi:MAG: type II toxin-antitoxin system HicB family antitoxin [Acidobacteria bacterium]|nr:type II toxin-antitoxin system HicB family antitoxin [Acidobacteriota bacterium]
MKTYDVIVRLVNNIYVAVVPALPGIRTEGMTRDDALFRAQQQAIEDYFKSAEVVSLSVDVPALEFRPHATVNDRLRLHALTASSDDMAAEVYLNIAAERLRDREELTLQDEEETAQAAQQQRRLEDLKRHQLEQRFHRALGKQSNNATTR